MNYNALIHKTDKLTGEVTVPGSKSYTHRVLAAASLGSHTLIKNPSLSHANRAMMDACNALGAKITRVGKDYDVDGFNGEPIIAYPEINVGNSGTALRISIALTSLAHGNVTITGDDSLKKRPTLPLVDALNELGSDVKAFCPEGNAPIVINASGLDGGHTTLDVTQSSQYLSSLLLVSPFAENDVNIDLDGTIVSKPYIDMTIEVLNNFNIDVERSDDYRHYTINSNQEYISPETYAIPGDYSQSAFFLAAGSLVDSDIQVKGLRKNDAQGDSAIIPILNKMGADITQYDDYIQVNGPTTLVGRDIDLIDSPDLFPVLAVLGAYAEGHTRLYNMPQIRTKETDRIAVMERELKRCGVHVESDETEMTVYQADLPEKSYELSAEGSQGVSDHRVAMALSLIGVKSGCAIIQDANCVNISYPEYFADLESLGVRTEEKPTNEATQNLAM